MPRSLSTLESKLILHLEWEKQSVVTIEEAARILNCSPDYARKVLHRLARDRWLAMIVPGKYELIPAERGEYAFTDTNPLFIGSYLVSPYYFSYATAAFYYGLTTQAPLSVYLATMQGKTRKLQIREKIYQVVLVSSRHFFGFGDANAYGAVVQMANLEKTILDSLHRPEYVGNIPEVATMLWRGKDRLNWTQMAMGALRFGSQSLLQRLGYLADLMKLPGTEILHDLLLPKIGKNTCYLGQPARWQTGGQHNSIWKIMDNIPRHELLADIEVV